MIERLSERPEKLTVVPPLASIQASELLVTRADAPLTDRLAWTSGAEPSSVIVSMPRGDGRLVVSGALDAWRFRSEDEAAFDRFWQSTIAGSLYYRPTVESSGSGGIGAVSTGILDPTVLMTLLFVAAAVFVNVSVAPEAKRQGRAVIRIRRAHLAVTVLTLVWPVLLVFLVMSLGQWGIRNLFAVIVACGALASAIHFAFGVFAIRLLRRA